MGLLRRSIPTVSILLVDEFIISNYYLLGTLCIRLQIKTSTALVNHSIESPFLFSQLLRFLSALCYGFFDLFLLRPL